MSGVFKACAPLLYVVHDCEKWVKIRSILLSCTTIKYIIQMYVTDTKDIEFKPYFTGFDTSKFSYRNNNDICVNIVLYYILISFKYWCTSSLKMTEFCQNMYMFTENCTVMFISCAYGVFLNE
jgi:uncharacterized membrane protein YwzB